MTFSKTTEPKYGARLIVQLIDYVAQTSPDRCFCLVPAADLAKNGFEEVSYGQMANAINRVAWWLREHFDRPVGTESLGYIGPPDLRYTLLTLAAQKAGFKAFFPSPRNSTEANTHLLEAAECRKFLTAEDVPTNLEEVLEQRKTDRMPMLTQDSCLDSTIVPMFAYEGTFEQARYRPFVALHTSGSTGLPSLVVPTHGTYAASDTYQMMPSLGHAATMVEVLRGKRVFVGMPSFHAAGLFMMVAMTTYFDMIPVIGPAQLLTAEMANDVHVRARVQVTCLPPLIIESLLDNKAFGEKLGTLDCVMYGGGPLSKKAGDQLARIVPVVCLMGSTETMLLPTTIAGRNDWQYFGFSPCMGAELRHHSDDLFRLFIVRKAEYESSQSVFYTFPHLEEYDTKDLYSRHATNPGLWRYRGRSDDMMVLSTGENVNPLDMEDIIQTHPDIDSALIAGQGRRRTSLLIHPKGFPGTSAAAEKLIDGIWPTIQRANTLCSAHGRVAKHLVLLTTTAKPMLRAGKGSIQRRQTIKLYKHEIDELYRVTKQTV
ncbi:MAG: hypothetical protein Q9226_008429 [Calogaya cf. arnoldii]